MKQTFGKHAALISETAAEMRRVAQDFSPALQDGLATAAVSIAAGMAKKRDAMFDPIRNDPAVAASYVLAMWRFVEDVAEKQSGTPRDAKDEAARAAMGTFAVYYAATVFKLYNRISGGEDMVAVPGLNYSGAEAQSIETDAFSFYENFLDAPLKGVKVAKGQKRLDLLRPKA